MITEWRDLLKFVSEIRSKFYSESNTYIEPDRVHKGDFVITLGSRVTKWTDE